MTEKEAFANLHYYKSLLLACSDAIAPYRMAWRRAYDNLADTCVQKDHVGQKIRTWRAPTQAEIATLDSVRAHMMDNTRDLVIEEKVLKEAVRVAELELRHAQKQSANEAKKTAQVSA